MHGYFRETSQHNTKVSYTGIFLCKSAFRQREQYVILFLLYQPYTKFAFLFPLCEVKLVPTS